MNRSNKKQGTTRHLRIDKDGLRIAPESRASSHLTRPTQSVFLMNVDERSRHDKKGGAKWLPLFRETNSTGRLEQELHAELTLHAGLPQIGLTVPRIEGILAARRREDKGVDVERQEFPRSAVRSTRSVAGRHAGSVQ